MTKKLAGFSLIEMMVAIAVLAVIASSVYFQNAEAISRQHTLEEKTIAYWLLDGQMTLLRLEQRIDQPSVNLEANFDRVVVGDRTFAIETTTIGNLSGKSERLRNVHIAIFRVEDNERIGPIAELQGTLGPI